MLRIHMICMPIINVHSSNAPHEDVVLIGDEIGLKAIRLAIEKALREGVTRFEAFASDGKSLVFE